MCSTAVKVIAVNQTSESFVAAVASEYSYCRFIIMAVSVDLRSDLLIMCCYS